VLTVNTELIRSLVGFVKAEEQARQIARSSMSPDDAYYRATFHDTPLTNELYLLVLLFLWHDIEKEMLLLAARSTAQNTTPISHDEYGKEIRRLASLKGEKIEKELRRLLPALDAAAWKLLDVLRLLANSFKHNPFDKPSSALLTKLGLGENLNYASLSESGAIRFGLGKFLGINEEATFSEIVDAVCKRCSGIVLMLEAGTPLRSFEHARVSLNPATFER